MWLVFPLIHFWLCHPALLYGLAFLLGVGSLLNGSWWLAIPCLCLWLPFLVSACKEKNHDSLKPLILSLLTFLTAGVYAAALFSFPVLPQGVTGQAYVKIKNISRQNSLFGERWLYRCEVKQFFPDNASHSLVASLPCLLTLPGGEKRQHARPLANQEYWVTSTLLQNEQGAYLLKVSSKAVWQPIPSSWSVAEQRYTWKRQVVKWIESHFSHGLSASFLAGLATGEFDDFWMRQQFARFGLQHLLAISGFHFAIIAGFLSVVFRLFFSQQLRLITLLICLGGYCFFLGPQASILRAWIMCSLTLLGGLMDKQTTALNSLGLALLLILGYDPLLCRELGFQLSFATTAAILLFYQPAYTWLSDVLPKRGLSEVIQMNPWNQHGYCVLAFLRQGLALTVAVNLFALPLTLFYFHQFPWMSLLYNLFFPFLASASLCLLLLGGLLTFVPFLAQVIHGLNDHYTFFLLQLTYQIPTEIDTSFALEGMDPAWLVLYLCCLTLGGIFCREKVHSSASQEIFSFI